MAGNAVTVVVAGEAKTGKSSLIFTAATENFPNRVSPVLPPVRMPKDMFPYLVPVTVIDTSSSTEEHWKFVEELKKADVVFLTHAWDRPDTLGKLRSYWLPELRELQVQVPIIVVGCMLDKIGDQQPVSLEQVMSPIMQEFREIEACLECSSLYRIQINEVFCYAQKAAIYPIAPLFDQDKQVIKPQCASALKRIFSLCDRDRDGFLSDAELTDFQVKCFSVPLQPSEIESVKRGVQEKLAYIVQDQFQLWEGANDQLREGINDHGLTLTGFLCLHALYIENGHLEKAWTVLRKFGYNNEMRLRGDQLPPPVMKYPDQSVELTSEAVQFLKRVFDGYDANHDAVLSFQEFEDLFSTAPEKKAPYVDAVAMTAFEGPSLNLFLSLWALMTLLDPIRSVETLAYLRYDGDLSSAIHVTRRRSLDREKQQSERTVYQCFVFGPKESGKSTLLNSFIGRPFSETYVATDGDKYAVKVVEQPSGHKKTLVLREIRNNVNEEFILKKDDLSACDVAVFVYDSSLEPSWKKAEGMLHKAAVHGQSYGYEVPCLIVSAKGDLEPYLTESQDSKKASLEMGINAPIRLGTMLENLSNVIGGIVTAAEHPHLSIPVPDRIVGAPEYPHLSIPGLLNRSVVYISGGVAVAVVAYFVYKKHSST